MILFKELKKLAVCNILLTPFILLISSFVAKIIIVTCIIISFFRFYQFVKLVEKLFNSLNMKFFK